MNRIIDIDHIGKKFDIAHVATSHTTLRDTVMEFLQHPFAHRDSRESIWALRDVTLSVQRGEVLGIIGRNGAGKSTLLKILGGITKPSEGKIRLWGKVSSLLDIGTGFHPELTGRENIYLNGVILGMRRQEVSRKFDQIVSFAGIEQFLDTPVKHYSSGMYVRLAFSIAAHLEPDILIVDEVLSVGDAEFQKRCLGKMEEVSQRDGRTVLFVSHDMHSITSLTQTCVRLDRGKVVAIGPSREVVMEYLSGGASSSAGNYMAPISATEPRIMAVSLETSDKGNFHRCGKKLAITFKLATPVPLKNPWLAFQIITPAGIPYTHLWTNGKQNDFCRTPGEYTLTCTIDTLRLYAGNYSLRVYFTEMMGGHVYNFRVLDKLESVCPFEVTMHGMEREFPWQSNDCTYIEDAAWSAHRDA